MKHVTVEQRLHEPRCGTRSKNESGQYGLSHRCRACQVSIDLTGIGGIGETRRQQAGNAKRFNLFNVGVLLWTGKLQFSSPSRPDRTDHLIGQCRGVSVYVRGELTRQS
jgi:hypothetical protein